MKNFKKYLVFVLAVSLSFQQGMYGAASSSGASSSRQAPSSAAASSSEAWPASSSQQTEPIVEFHDSGLPTRVADYLAETRFFQWLGNYITRLAQEAFDARKENTKKGLQQNWKDKKIKKAFSSIDPKLDTQDPKELAKYAHDCFEQNKNSLGRTALFWAATSMGAAAASPMEPIKYLSLTMIIFATAHIFYSFFKYYKEKTTTTNNIKAQLITLEDSELSQLITKVIENKKSHRNLKDLKDAIIKSIVSAFPADKIPDFGEPGKFITFEGRSNLEEPLAPWQNFLLCAMQLFAQVVPNTTSYPSQEEYGMELHEQLVELAKDDRLERFDVCHERPNDLRQCCTIHDNTRIECCLIDTRSGLEICKTIYLVGHPSKIHRFEYEKPTPALPPFDPADLEHSSLVIDYPLFNHFAEKLTTNTSITPGLIITTSYGLNGVEGSSAAYFPQFKMVMFTQEMFLNNLESTLIPNVLAHELGHHQQHGNNPVLMRATNIVSLSFSKRIDLVLRNKDYFLSQGITTTVSSIIFPYHISEKSVRAFNIEFNADIHSYLLTENAALIDFFLLKAHPLQFLVLYAKSLKLGIIDNTDHCSLPHSLTEHPDELTCRIPLLAELHEKYPVLVKELEEQMERARAAQAASASPASSSSSN
ncbi:M48 family metalloprotease [Candidatus Babeliales bacterium]|nr:M48 family metalloprotease [Candidatus Babeliales bacterium]